MTQWNKIYLTSDQINRTHDSHFISVKNDFIIQRQNRVVSNFLLARSLVRTFRCLKNNEERQRKICSKFLQDHHLIFRAISLFCADVSIECECASLDV